MLKYRTGNVDNTTEATGWIKEEFDIDVNSLGHLNPQAVRQMSLDANEMLKQVQMANVFVKAAKTNMDGKVEIEKLRKELLAEGLASKEEVDGIVLQMIMLTQKHKGHISKMVQEMNQGKSLINANEKSRSELSRLGFQDKLRELRARHHSKRRETDEASRENIDSIRRNLNKAKGDRADSRRFADYISANGESQNRFAIGGGGRPQSLHSKAPINNRGARPFGLLRSLFG